MKKVMIIMLLALVGSIGYVAAQVPKVITSDKTGWHKIGETTVDFKRDKDEVAILGADKFAAIKFKVDDESINLIDLEVYYESGDTQKININLPLKAPGESRQIDLNGGERSLKKVVFVYKTLPNYQNKKAHVELWGLKTNADSSK
jgi:hypothetical protein